MSYTSELDRFMQVLDDRMRVKVPLSQGMVAKKVRRVGAPSKSLPPLDAPKWAVKNFEGIAKHDSF